MIAGSERMPVFDRGYLMTGDTDIIQDPILTLYQELDIIQPDLATFQVRKQAALISC